MHAAWSSATHALAALVSALLGRMLSLILSHSRYHHLAPPVDAGTAAPVWKALLRYALEQRARGIIDAGALLAGVPVVEMARFVVQLLTGSEGARQDLVDFHAVV